MAYNYFRFPTYSAVAQVDTFTITADSTSNTAVWTFTLTLPNSDTATVTYTEDGSPTVAEIATGLFNAWNASTNPHISQITAANPSSGVVTLTADTAGVPFSVALADSDDGTHTQGATTANASPNDYGLAQNWSLNAVPTTNDDVVLDVGSVGLLHSLNQSSAAIDEFVVMPGCSSQIGKFDNGKPWYLRIDPNVLEYYGSGSLAMFDIGSANISPIIEATGSPSATGRHTVYLKGSNIATAFINKGNVGIAPMENETSTVATVQIGYVSTQASDANVTIGSGVTLTTLNQGGGVCKLGCAATTVTVASGSTSLTTEGTGAITTVNVYGGTVYLNSTGTITTLNIYGGTVYLSKSRSARTVTTTNLYDGAVLYTGSWITHTNKPWPAQAGTSTIHYVG